MREDNISTAPHVAARDVYDDWHSRHDVDAEADTPWHQLIRRYLDPERDLVNRRALEIGCGRGGFSCWLARQGDGGTQVVAADFSPTAVSKGAAFAAARGVTNIDWQVADIQVMSQFADGEFDTVFSCETIEHVPDPPLAVRQLARVLKPGGRLFLTTPNYFSTMGLYRAYCWLRGKKFDEGGQPICQVNMTFKTRSWAKRAGLRILRTDGVGQYLPFPGRPPIPLPALERPRFLMRWLTLHSLVVAQKPGS